MDRTTHQWDPARAERFRPRTGVEKTAILFTPVDSFTITTLRTTFGEQELVGPFYLVADGDGSYGAARKEFEQTNHQIGENRWVKSAKVEAYKAEAGEVLEVDTEIGDHREASVTAEPGQWIVRQATGELMVIASDEFERRYEPTSNGDAS